MSNPDQFQFRSREAERLSPQYFEWVCLKRELIPPQTYAQVLDGILDEMEKLKGVGRKSEYLKRRYHEFDPLVGEQIRGALERITFAYFYTDLENPYSKYAQRFDQN